MYQWLDCDNNNSFIEGASSQTYIATQNGSYAVEVTQNGCSDISDCLTVNTIGIDENELVTLITVHPNPNNGYMTLDLGQKHETIEILVLDISGKIVDQLNYSNSQEVTLNLTVPNGNYFLKITNEKLQQTIKISIN